MAVYTPALMLQDGGADGGALGYPVEVAYIVVKACLAIGLWGAAVVGFLFGPMAAWERLARVRRRRAAGRSPLPLTDEAGFALAALVIGAALVATAQRRRRRA